MSDVDDKIGQLQLIEQNMQHLASQRQQFQLQLNEIESALKEVRMDKDAYKIIGNLMLKANVADVKKELEEKKGMLDVRVKSIEKQETQLKKKAEDIRQDVLKTMKK